MVGVQQGTTGEEYVEEEDRNRRLQAIPEGGDAFNGARGRPGRRRRDRPPGRRKSGEEDSGIEISGGIETEEQYGFVVQQGDEELLDELNEALKEVIDSGEYETIYKKWFHKPVPPTGFTTHARAERALRIERAADRKGAPC